ncbi:MAG TPA: hypothetical protein VFK65_05725, partial [Candidatus Binatia bacterium]|nr:hypothetical protein [Candidatus Binatia bacterium]
DVSSLLRAAVSRFTWATTKRQARKARVSSRDRQDRPPTISPKTNLLLPAHPGRAPACDRSKLARAADEKRLHPRGAVQPLLFCFKMIPSGVLEKPRKNFPRLKFLRGGFSLKMAKLLRIGCMLVWQRRCLINLPGGAQYE